MQNEYYWIVEVGN